MFIPAPLPVHNVDLHPQGVSSRGSIQRVDLVNYVHIGYSKDNLKIHTGVPSRPFLPSLTLPSPSSPSSPPSPPFLHSPSLRSRAP